MPRLSRPLAALPSTPITRPLFPDKRTRHPQPKMGPPITPQTKSVVFKAVQYYKARKLDPTTAEYRDDINVNKTVAKITGLSEQSVRRIVNEGKAMGENVNFTAPKRRKQVRRKRIEIDEFTKGTVRRKVTEFYRLRKEMPSINKVRKVLSEEGILKCGYTYMRLLLKELGFQYKHCENKKLLVENQSVVQRRGKYIRDIRKCRAEGRPIFFKEEIFVNETDKKPNTAATSSQTDADASSSAGKGHRLVIVHAGGSTGFVDGTRTIFKTHVKGEEDPGTPDFTDFVWVCEKLLPSLPPNSVMIMDHPKNTNKEEDKAPTKCSSKDEMQEWLTRNHIAYTEAMNRKDLLELIKEKKPKQEFKIDIVLKEQGRTVLYLPPHHPELNPIQLVWGDIKSELAQKHAKSDLSEKERAMEELFLSYSPEKWEKCDSHVETVEEEYFKNDHLSDEVMNQLQINLRNDEESENDSCPNHSDDESDMDTD